MTPGSESQTLDTTRSTALLSTRTPISIGAWNVRTMYETGKTSQVVTEMCNYGIDVLGISEARWIQSGQTRIRSGEMLLYSGHEEEDAPHTQGVAMMLSKTAQKALIGWEVHGPRIITASFRTMKRRVILHVIQCYGPTNDATEEEKDIFYSRLQTILERTNNRNLNILMGDFNAKIGNDNIGYTEIMGKNGLGVMNDNGERFAAICALNDLVIGGSVFEHKRIHKATWISPDGKTENQIDHICIGKRFRRSMLDVKVRRGADVASDHHLLVAQLKLKLKKEWTATVTQRRRFNVSCLRDATQKGKFKVALSNRFQVLRQFIEEGETVDISWGNVKEVVKTTCKEVLGPLKPHHKDWLSTKSIKLTQERRECKAKVINSRTRAEKSTAQEQYTSSNRAVKTSIRADKRRFIVDLATEAEVAAGRGNMREVYQITKRITGKFSKPERPVKDKDGNTLMGAQQQKDRWKGHFEELLNRPPPQNPLDITPAEVDLPIDCGAPTREEIRKATSQLKNNKAAGPDSIPPEALKADVDTTVEILLPLFQKIWLEGKVPSEWKEGYLIKLPKKGDLSNCANYRGIMLLSIPGKVFYRIILNRMKDQVDSHLRDQQAGFRKGRSCVDQITTLRIIVEQSLEWNSSLYLNFVDYEKAFDSLDRNSLWKLLRHYGVPIKLTSIIRNSYEGMSCRVIHEGQPTEAFEVKTGVRQGCLLSPFLFLLAIDWIMKTSTSRTQTGIWWTPFQHLEDLDFADDLALMSHTHQQMQEKTDRVAETSARTGLLINKSKTKVLRVNARSEDPINLAGKGLDEVDAFTYLGSVIDRLGGTDADVKARIGKARAMFMQLKNIWKPKELSLQTKLRIFNSNVKSVLLYGAESWRTTVAAMMKVQTFINSCLRRILGIHWPTIISNKDLWEKTNQTPVEEEILRRRWGWIGHTLRKPAASITKHALSWNPQGKRKRGRPRNSWRRDLDADAKRMGHSWRELERKAQDRDAWRTLLNGLYPRRGNRL